MLDVSSKETVQAQSTAPPWGPVAGIVVSFGGFVLVQLVAAIIIATIVQLFNLYPEGDWLESTTAQFGFVVLSDALILSVLWQFLRSRRSGFGALGFARKITLSDAGYAVVAYLAYLALLVVILSIVGTLTGVDLDKKQELGFESIVTVPEKLLAFASLVILPPLVEETLFRGFLFTGLRKKVPFLGATIVTSVLFAALHLLGTSDGLLWVAGIDTLILSFALCYLREKTGALWAPIMVHALKNSLAFILFLKVVGS